MNEKEYDEFLMAVNKAAFRYRLKNPVNLPATFGVERDMLDFNTVKSLISDVENKYNKMLESAKNNLTAGSNIYDYIDGPNGLGEVKGDLENLFIIKEILDRRIFDAGYDIE